ncbi:hypothetical protein [Natrinema caseinilyticum]|uniref:hypothetical protein n=1 Tax=Natrinema caseinilyticum TaxID=2961570 RepID=UPI0020C33664|nr:hypothetical protein [Natrinema caseinilyticum]
MGLALAIAGIVQTLETPVTHPVDAFELVISLLVPTGLATGGYWLASRNVTADVRWRVVTRVSFGIVVACAVGVLSIGYVTFEGGSVNRPLSLVTSLAAIGGASGFLAAMYAAGRTSTAKSTDAGTTRPVSTTANEVPESVETPGSDGATATSAATSPSGPSPTRSAGATADPSGAGTRAHLDVAFGPDASDGARRRSPPERTASLETVAAVPTTAETILEVLGDEQARITLAVLYHGHGGERRSVAELTRVVAQYTDARAGVVARSLRHSTLPRLHEIRAIDWDPSTDRVMASDQAVFEEAVREAVVLLETFEPGTR